MYEFCRILEYNFYFMRPLILLTAILFNNNSFSQEPGEVILRKSAAACKALSSINYEVYSENFAGKITADITIRHLNMEKESPVFGISQLKVSGIALNNEGSTQVSFAF